MLGDIEGPGRGLVGNHMEFLLTLADEDIIE